MNFKKHIFFTNKKHMQKADSQLDRVIAEQAIGTINFTANALKKLTKQFPNEFAERNKSEVIY